MTKKYPFQNQELTIEERVTDLLNRLTIDEKIGFLTTQHFAVERLGIDEFGIGLEIARGYVGREKENISTVFPQPIGMASTFDTELMEKIGTVAGDETRAYFNHHRKHGLMVWGPTVDMERHPFWGRTEEAYGEDPYLTGEMTVAYTKGLVGMGDGVSAKKTIPTLKHFCANNNEFQRGKSSSNLELRQRHEYYYSAFEPAITRGGAYSIMASYNELCHEPAVINKDIQTILKDRWGLGYVVTDGGDFSQNVTDHELFSTHSESLAKCLKAGCDCMTDDSELVHKSAYNALKNGLISEKDIDKAVYNALDARFRLGLFDENCPYDTITDDVIDCENHRAINRESALKGVTLLKNDGILPLDASKPMKIAVIGTLADENLRDWYTGTFSYKVSVLDGIKKEFPNAEIHFDNGYDIIALKCNNGKYLSVKADGTIKADADEITDSEKFEFREWDDRNKWVNLFSVKYKKFVIADGDTLKLGSDEVYAWFTSETFTVTYNMHSRKSNFEDYLHHRKFILDGENIVLSKKYSNYDENLNFDIEYISKGWRRISDIANNIDLAIVCFGNDPIQYAKECFDRSTLDMIGSNDYDIVRFLGDKVPVILNIISSYPYTIPNIQDFNAIIYSSHAGAELGTAIAQTLNGKNNPAGRTPMTWYADDYQLPDIMQYDIRKGKLTYQYFDGEPLYPFGYGLSYSEFKYENFKISDNDDSITAEISVTNISDVDGDEVVQLYYSATDSKVYRPIKKLCGFKRVHIKAHQTENVKIQFSKRELKFWHADSDDFFLENCTYLFMVGTSSADIRLKQELKNIIGAKEIPLRQLLVTTNTYKCDDMDGGEFFYSLKHDCLFFKTTTWNGTLIFENVDISDKSKLCLTASTSVGQCNMTVKINDATYSLTIPASDGNDDFNTFTINIQSSQEPSNISIHTSEGCCVKDIKLS